MHKKEASDQVKSDSPAADLYSIHMGTMEEGIRYFNIKGCKWKKDKTCTMKEDPVGLFIHVLQGDSFIPSAFNILNLPEVHEAGSSMMISWERVPYTFRYEIKVTHNTSGEILNRKTRVNGFMLKNLEEGEYTVDITARNNCGTTSSESFQLPVEGPVGDLSDYEVILDQSFFVYNGEPQYPQVSVTNGEEHLEEGVDYVVFHRDNVKPGMASVNIVGIGRYSGTLESRYRIIVKPFWKKFIIDAE